MEKQLVPIRWPMAGIDKRFAYQSQPPNTTIDALNVRPDSASESRERGGTRPGLLKAFTEQLGDLITPITEIKLLNTVQYISGSSLLSRIVAVANGTLYREEPAGTLVAVSSAVSLSTTKLLHGAMRNQVFYIADHSDTPATSAAARQPKKYTPSSNTLANWTASDGTIPKGCPCICTWRDRLILGGGTDTPHGLFASAQNDPDDWDYSEQTSGSAWSLTLASAGQMGDTINAISPHADNCLIIGCSTSIHILRGDPGDGGDRAYISQQHGVIDRGAWCETPDGLFVFLSHDGLYAIAAGCDAAGGLPKSISRERMPEELLAVDKSTTTVAMAYDLRDRGIHIYLTPNTATGSSATHWWFDWETKSFWKVSLGLDDHEPFAIHTRQNYVTNQSQVLLGCRDGYVRRHSHAQATDDSSAFSSYVFIGPLGDSELYRDVSVDEMIASLQYGGGDVAWSLFTGAYPEAAYASTAKASGTWDAGRNRSCYPRVGGAAIYLKLANGETGVAWGWESGNIVLSRRGKTRP